MKILRCLVPIVFLSLAACGGGGSGGTTATPAPEPEATLTVSGVAATGAALDGATIEIIDASGNLVELDDSLITGADGSYQVELPASIALPVIIRVTPANGGSPLLNVVAPSEGATTVVANINPITSLVSNSVLGDDLDATDNAALASALSAAAPTSTSLDESGDAVVEKLLGAAVDYSSFASDPDFVAQDGTSSGSAADTILDALAMQADSDNMSLTETLRSLNQQAEPAALLEQPEFQVQVVSALVVGGAVTDTLATQLDAIGAITVVAEGEADVFATIIAVVPTAINNTLQNASDAGLNGSQALLDIAVDAAVDLIATTVQTKSELFASSDSDLVDLLTSPSFQATTTETVAGAITPILLNFVNNADINTALDGLAAVTGGIIEQASDVVASFDFDATSADVSDLVVAFVTENVLPESDLNIDDLVAIQNNDNNVDAVVSDVGTVADVQNNIPEFIENTDGVDFEGIEDVIPQIPTGVWDQSNWDDFNWA